MRDAKTDIDGLYKTSEGAVVNKDNAALTAYKRRKKQSQDLRDVKEDVDMLKTDMQEIKDLLKALVNKG